MRFRDRRLPGGYVQRHPEVGYCCCASMQLALMLDMSILSADAVTQVIRPKDRAERPSIAGTDTSSMSVHKLCVAGLLPR